MDHYVRAYDPVTDTEEWIGPLPLHMAGLVAEGLDGKRQTRVYHKSELPGAPDKGTLKATLEAELERCKQVQALFEADPDMKFGEALRRVCPADDLTGSGWFCSACGEPRPCDTHEYKP